MSLFNHLWGSNNPKILAPIPKFAEIVNNPDVLRTVISRGGGGDGSTDCATRHNYSASDV